MSKNQNSKHAVRDLLQLLFDFLVGLSFSIAQFICSMICHALLIYCVFYHENQAYEDLQRKMMKTFKFLWRTRYWKVISLKNHRKRNLYISLETSLLHPNRHCNFCFLQMYHIVIKEITRVSIYKGQEKCFGYDAICPMLADCWGSGNWNYYNSFCNLLKS